MAVSKVGRPYQVAALDLAKDPAQELYDRFYQACAALRYSDTVVLSRALGLHERSIRRWQYGENFPKRDATAMLIIRWVDNGKPRKVITQAGATRGMI